MVFNRKVVKYNAISFAFFGLFSLVFGLTGLGAMAILFAAGNIFIALICFVSKKNDQAKTCLLIGGCLALVGFALCSTFPLNI